MTAIVPNAAPPSNSARLRTQREPLPDSQAGRFIVPVWLRFCEKAHISVRQTAKSADLRTHSIAYIAYPRGPDALPHDRVCARSSASASSSCRRRRTEWQARFHVPVSGDADPNSLLREYLG